MNGTRRLPYLLARAAIVRGVALAIAWYILAEGSLYNFPLAVVVIITATTMSMIMAPPTGRWRLSPPALASFAGWFLLRSLRAGADVARRAVHPALPVAPALVTIHTVLPGGAPRIMLVAVLSLLPGTLSVHIQGDSLLLHVLDEGSNTRQDIRWTERQIAAILLPGKVDP